MRDDMEQRRKLIEHLEAAIRLAEDLGENVTAFLTERALDEARASLWPAG